MSRDDLPLAPGVAASWGLVTPSGRGRKPRLQAHELVAVAVAVADAEGLAAVSMPRVARAVGVTQNALYRHVASKDELVALMADNAVGTPPDLDDVADWQAGSRAWTRAVLEVYRAHPWMLTLPVQAPMTRGAVRWTEALLRVLRPTGLGLDDRLQCVILLDGHARTVAAMARDLSDREPAYDPESLAILVPVMQQQGCHEFARLLCMPQTAQGPANDDLERETDFGTERIIDGVQLLVERREQNRP